MIGKQIITVTLLPKIGDRDDYSVRAIGPGETDYTFPLSMTGTILAIWQTNSQEAAKYLAEEILDVIGTASVPPKDGFWFDSYNSLNTLKATTDRMRNEGIQSFTKGEYKNTSIRLLGNELFTENEKLNKFFAEKFGFEFFRSFEDAFEDSQVIEDLNTPASDNAHFLYRVCILSGIIDHFNVRLAGEPSEVKSLQALKNWLGSKLDVQKADKLVKPFQMVKYLRKQYPIHEHFSISADGIRMVRQEITEAKTFFGIGKDFPASWANVLKVFKQGLEEMRKALETTS
jgi:hypothetical protein